MSSADKAPPGVATPDRTVHATLDALRWMLAQAPGRWVAVDHDFCPDCGARLEACWTLPQGIPDETLASRAFTLTLRCVTCRFTAASQHRMNRWRSP